MSAGVCHVPVWGGGTLFPLDDHKKSFFAWHFLGGVFFRVFEIESFGDFEKGEEEELDNVLSVRKFKVASFDVD